MKILEVKTLPIPEIKVVRFARFRDARGYFTETHRKSDFTALSTVPSLKDADFVQVNESYSKPHVARGLHFQWNPYVGKLVRTVHGRMIDLVLDIRRGSPTLGKVIAYDIPGTVDAEFGEWIWVPPGFAHGNFFTEPSVIEYFCSGAYNPACEAGITPLSPELDWSLCDPTLRALWERTIQAPDFTMSDKDRAGLSLSAWIADDRSKNFEYRG